MIAPPARAAVPPPRLGDPSRGDPAAVAVRFAGAHPSLWGDHLPGTLPRLPVRYRTIRGRRHPLMALTFDACGNPRPGSCGYDAQLIAVLRRYRVPATLFVSSRWAAAGSNGRILTELAADPLFEIGNHGTRHCPLSVTGRSAYGIAGTRSTREAADEVWTAQAALHALIGRAPRLFRTGTAMYDDIGVAVARSLGVLPVGFTVAADFGATAPAAVVRKQLLAMTPGAIALGHLNHPEKQTAEGLALALPAMLRAGWVFTQVSRGLS
jgi:peptidoglycan/xylan/chitin deacetylase (PgdA/CDA1 family)